MTSLLYLSAQLAPNDLLSTVSYSLGLKTLANLGNYAVRLVLTVHGQIRMLLRGLTETPPNIKYTKAMNNRANIDSQEPDF